MQIQILLPFESLKQNPRLRVHDKFKGYDELSKGLVEIFKDV